MRKPRALRPGDTVGIVSPASPVTSEKLEAGIRLLKERGYRVELGSHVFAADGHLAGTDEQRASDLHSIWFDDSIHAVICSRGGYGVGRLMQMLDLDGMVQKPKLLVGFSDITQLHVALNRRGLATLHAPMLLSFVRERAPWVVQMWFDAMEGNGPVRLPEAAPRAKALRGGSVEGEVIGGCLCLLCDSLATPDALDASNKIVLLEDVDEAPHRVDAMLTHLLNAGVLQKAAGLVIGEMTGTDNKLDEGIGGKPWHEIVEERVRGLNCPIVTGFPLGHQEHMASLPLGIHASLDADRGELIYSELGVEP